MSAFEWNKVIGAILAALLVIKVVDIAGDTLVHAKVPEKHAYPVAGIAPAKPSEGDAKKAPVQVAAITPLLSSASVDKGKQAAKKCAICHTFEKGGANKIGPNLWDIVGKKMGSGEHGFAFSDGMKKKGATADFETLSHFLFDPRGFVPGTKMAFAGIKDDAERAAVIAYLRSLSDNPVPLP